MQETFTKLIMRNLGLDKNNTFD